MGLKAEKKTMRISNRGNDEGSIMLLSVIAIFSISLIFLSFISYTGSMQNLAQKEKKAVLVKLANENKEIMDKYDIH
jgi:hypothetical protein